MGTTIGTGQGVAGLEPEEGHHLLEDLEAILCRRGDYFDEAEALRQIRDKQLYHASFNSFTT